MTMDELARRLKEKRAMTGQTQRAAAADLGIANTYLSQLESGKIDTPSPDVRRRLAQYLGISHLDVLVMTGEITADEVTDSGRAGIREPNPSDPATELHALIDQVNWYGRSDRVAYVKGLLSSMLDVDRQYKEEV